MCRSKRNDFPLATRRVDNAKSSGCVEKKTDYIPILNTCSLQNNKEELKKHSVTECK